MARYAAYDPVITVSKMALKIRISFVVADSFAKAPRALKSPCAAMQTTRLFDLKYIITNIKPAAVA